MFLGETFSLSSTIFVEVSGNITEFLLLCPISFLSTHLMVLSECMQKALSDFIGLGAGASIKISP